MNIYAKKTVWKRILVLCAMLIVGISFWYTSRLVKRVANEERKQVQLWANAIRKKAKLVNYTKVLFEKLREEERKRVELWLEATNELVNRDGDLQLPLLVVEYNTTIPIIITDNNGEIVGSRNVDGVQTTWADSLTPADKQRLIAENDSIEHAWLEAMKSLYPPIEAPIYGNTKNYIYHGDSKLFQELKNTFNDLQNSFIQEIVANSASTPVLYVQQANDSVIAHGNVKPEVLNDSVKLNAYLATIADENEPIQVDLGTGEVNYIYYSDSEMLRRLKYYPFVQFIVIGLFILIGYWLFSISRRSEQNQVWVGMSKETAHQLGTPLSSLMGWIEVLKLKGVDESVTTEMNKDLKRLEMITDRFSKIGSKPKLKPTDLYETVTAFTNYLKVRNSSKITFEVVNSMNKPAMVQLNVPLFEWVIENLCKNAIDAMAGKGLIRITFEQREDTVIMDIMDTGKGIPPSKRKAVFQPGYTSKQRGWGLGLSLSKRIIENYHSGKIMVKRSELGKGTTFRIILKNA